MPFRAAEVITSFVLFRNGTLTKSIITVIGFQKVKANAERAHIIYLKYLAIFVVGLTVVQFRQTLRRSRLCISY